MEYPVIISYSNFGYYDFAKICLLNLNRVLKFHKVHFYCLDREIYESLTSLDLSNLDITFELIDNRVDVSKNFEHYLSLQYNLITHTKMDILRDALEKYDFIHFIDCDVLCIHEPLLEHYEKYKDYDIVFQYDAGMNSSTQLHADTLHHIWCCTGNTTFRNTIGAHHILDKITEYQNTNLDKNDQQCLYQYFLDIGITDISTHPDAKLFTYEVQEYTNGYWLNHNIGTLDATYFFHANHVIGKENKMRLLQKAFFHMFNGAIV